MEMEIRNKDDILIFSSIRGQEFLSLFANSLETLGDVQFENKKGKWLKFRLIEDLHYTVGSGSGRFYFWFGYNVYVQMA